MPTKKIITYAFLHAIATVIYVALVALIITNSNTLFGKQPSILTAAMAFLLAFVVSAAITGSLVLGRPVLWYFNGNKNEAIKLALYTIAFICFITLIVLAILALGAK